MHGLSAVLLSVVEVCPRFDSGLVMFQISDDEDDTHPNIDTPSLFKWRHEARLQRMEEFESQKRAIQEEKDK